MNPASKSGGSASISTSEMLFAHQLRGGETVFRHAAIRNPALILPLVLSGSAWFVLYALAAGDFALALCTSPSLESFSGTIKATFYANLQTSPLWLILSEWVLMVLAMMLPLTTPNLAQIHARSFVEHRVSTVTSFAFGYVATWVALGGVVIPLAFFLRSIEASIQHFSVLPLMILLALFAIRSKWRRRALRQCHVTHPLRQSGWTFNPEAFSFAVRYAAKCALICLPIMTLLIATGAGPVWMFVAMVALMSERLAHDPDRDHSLALIALHLIPMSFA